MEEEAGEEEEREGWDDDREGAEREEAESEAAAMEAGDAAAAREGVEGCRCWRLAKRVNRGLVACAYDDKRLEEAEVAADMLVRGEWGMEEWASWEE